MDILDILQILVVVVAFWVGYIYREFKFIKELIEINSKMRIELLKQENQVKSLGLRDITKLKHEVIDNINYFFEELSNTFVAQGATLEEAAKHYTSVNGADICGWFTHAESNRRYCFVNNKCMEFKNEQL